MTVALIAHYIGPRLGIGQYLDRLLPPLVEQLNHQKIDFKILASPNAAQQTPALQKLADHVEILPSLDNSPNKRYAWVATNFHRYCQSQNITAAVWLSNPIVLPWHPPTLAVIHDVNEWKTPDKYGSRLKTALRSAIYLDASIRFAKKIVTVSHATERDLLHFRSSTKLKNKLIAIPNGSDSPLASFLPVQVDAPKAPFLLSVGRIDPSAKRLPEAVSLVKALRETSSQPWELHLVGGMNKSTQQAGEAFLKSVENLPWVRYHGHIDDASLAEWYRQATAVVFLADSEGFGLPIAEAASFGRWVLVSQKNQAGIEAGGNAIIPVAPDNSKEAAQEVLHRLQNTPQPPNLEDMPTWQNAAVAYAAEIASLVGSGK